MVAVMDPKRFHYGFSCEGRPLEGWSNRPLSDSGQELEAGGTLLLGGIHGDEPATGILLERFLAEELSSLDPEALPVAIVPVCNPDGLRLGSRYNVRGVDLNRNFPHQWRSEGVEPPGGAPLSEPESLALAWLIRLWRPRRVLSLHWALAELDADGPQSTELAGFVWGALGEADRVPYRLRVSPEFRPEGWVPECPGSLGQWCGYGLKDEWGWAPAMLTVELPYAPLAQRPEVLAEDHLSLLQLRWKADAEGYLGETWPAVRKMLLAACRFPMKG
jgi:hypothetical protein